MGVPDRRRAGTAAQRSGSPIVRQPGKIEYTTTERIGFECLPDAVSGALWKWGVLVGTMLAGTAQAAVAKRRTADGSYYQYSRGWWTSEWRHVTVEAERPLRSRGEGKLAPDGEWQVSGTVFEFPCAVRTLPSVWRFQPSNADGSPRRTTQHRSEDPLDLLPPQLVAPIIGGEADCWREYGKGWATETVVASKILDARVLLLHANREATSRRALDGADWLAETVDTSWARSAPYSGAVSDPSTRIAIETQVAAQAVERSPQGRGRAGASWDQYHRRACIACGTKTRWRDDEGRALCPRCNPVR